MGKKLPPKEMELYRRIDEILFYKWDPIGVSDSAWARDEYQSYLPTVFKQAMDNSTALEIATQLSEYTEYIGMPATVEQELEVAELILAVKESLEI